MGTIFFGKTNDCTDKKQQPYHNSLTINDKRSSAFCSPRRWPPLRAECGACGSDLEAHTFCVLQIGNDLKQIASSRIPVRAKHLVKSLYVNLRMRCQLGKADCGIDVVTQ